MQRKRSATRTGPIVAVVCGITVVVLVIVWLVVIPRVVASQIAAAADERALAIQHGSTRYRFTSAEVDAVAVTPKGSKAMVITAPVIEARLSGVAPSLVTLRSAEVSLAGSFESVLRALEPVREADRKLPEARRVPIDLLAGKVRWKSPLGDETALAFDGLTASVRATELKVQLRNGRLELPTLTIEPLSVDLKRSTAKGEAVDLVASLGREGGDEGFARFELRHDASRSTIEATLEDLALDPFAPKVTGLDLSKATLAGELAAERDEESAVSSKGKLVFSKVRLPPVSVGPVSVVIGGTVRVTWKASPKKGAPGTAKIDDARVDVVLGGKTRTVKVSGEVAVGEEGEGPYTVKLDWEAGPIACSEIAKDLAGAVAGGLASSLAGSAVSGNVTVKGTLRGDLAEADAMKRTFEIVEACKLEVDLMKTAGGLLKSLPSLGN